MMKCVMLLLMSLSLPKIPAQLHTHLYASPKSHRPKDCKQSQIIFQWRKMSVCVCVCVCVCYPFSFPVSVSWEDFFLSNISKYNVTLKLTGALSPEHYFSKGFELLKMGLSWEFVCSPDCKDSGSRNDAFHHRAIPPPVLC